MAKRKKQPSKARRKKTRTARPKARKVTKVARGNATKIARGKATKRTVARGKPKRAQVKKAAKPVSATVETVAIEGSSVPTPNVTTATKIEAAEASQVS